MKITNIRSEDLVERTINNDLTEDDDCLTQKLQT